MAVVFLSLLLEYAFRRWGSCPKRKSGPCGKVRYSALGGSSVHSREARGRGTMSVDSGVSLLLQVCVVVLALLLMAGDIERNPGPTDKKGWDHVDKVLPDVDDSPLEEEDFFDLLEDLIEIVASWKAIGNGLRLSSGTLDEIETRHDRNPRDCMSEVLRCWLRKNYNVDKFGEPTWQTVVKVVAQPAAGNNCALALRLAEKHSVIAAATPQSSKKSSIRSREDSCASSTVSDDVFTSEGASVCHRPSSRTQSEEPPFGCGCGKCTLFSFSESGCPNPVTLPSSFSGLDVRGCDHEQQQCPNSVTSTSLDMRGRDHEQQQSTNSVTSTSSFSSLDVRGRDHEQQQCTNSVTSTSSFSSLDVRGFDHEQQKTLQRRLQFESGEIITELGAGEHKQELQECICLSETDHADVHVFVKVDSHYESYTVGELEGFQHRLSGILDISSQSALHLCRVEEGCLQLMFQVPSIAHQKIFPLSSQQERVLAAERVVKLTCGNYEFVAKGKDSKSEPEDTGIGFAEFIKLRINEWRTEGKHLLKILVAGKVGVGKSSLVNGLIGREVAEEGDTATSVTRTVNKYEVKINDVDVIIFDTPGLLDPKARRDRETLQEIGQKTEGAIDLLLICLRMTERIDQTHILIIQKLKQIFKMDTIWKNTLLVLTFANEVHLPRTRCQIGAQPEDEETKLNEYFEMKLSEFRKELPGHLQSHIPANLLKEIPVVPAGYDDPNLPGYDDWLSNFWVKAFTRAPESAKVALLRISEDRFVENPSRDIIPPHLQSISMQVAYGAIVGAALGKVVGDMKGLVFHDREIEDIRHECRKKGASLGARFVLYFYTLKNPLEHTVEWFIEQIATGTEQAL